MDQPEELAVGTAAEVSEAELPTHRSWLHRTFAGSYRIEAVLGEGAMGQVLLATDIHLERAVAIKVLKPGTAERIQNDQRFRREARVLSRLNHPNVVTLYAFGTLDDGTGYIVMERVDGEALTRYCEADNLLPPEKLSDVIEQICQALSAAHRQGIVHRDIKPTNVLIGGLDGDQPSVKVLDFGLAKPLDAGSDPGATMDLLATTEGAAIGTPAYMSPEQACGDSVDGRADIYGLACLATQLLTGHLPFGGVQGTQMVMAHVQQKPRLPSQLRQGPEFLPGGALDRVMSCALQKNPDDRFVDAMSFATAFSAALKGEHADGFDPMQTGPVTGAFEDTSADKTAPSKTAFGATQLSGATQQAPQAVLPSHRQVAALHLELSSLGPGTEDQNTVLIGDALGIAEARIRAAITVEGGEVLGGLVGNLKGTFSAEMSPPHAIEAAVQAALGIRKALQSLSSDPILGEGFEPTFCMGIDLGGLYVGSNFRGEAIAHGPALAGASAMARATSSGEIRLSKRCYRLARGRFHYAGASAFQSEIGPAVIGLLSTYQPSETEIYGVPIPHIGVEREAARLRAMIDDALDLMPGGRVLIQGPPGIGKTRLVAETVDSFDADERLLIYEAGQCTLGGHSIPYRPFVQAIRSRAGVVQDDDAATVGDKIETLIGRWLIQDGEEPQDLDALRGFLKALLDVSPSMDPDASRTVKEPDAQFVREGLASYYTRLLERAPVLLFVDDFMHASPQTRDLVHFLVERFADSPFTTVLCARSDEMVRLATYLDLEGSSPPIEIHLEPLGESETQRLVRAVLNRADSAPDDLVSAIAHLASGVPQIVVEAIYELIEAEVIRVEEEQWLINPDAQETVRLPESAEELFRERVHRLSPGQRELVEIAAVAGDVFWPDLLVSMAKNAVREDDIRGLVDRGFFKGKRDAMVDGNQGYGFAQVAMAESVYRNIPLQRRRELHGSIAMWLESLPDGAAQSDDALIGTHYRIAERAKQALPYLMRSGAHALAHGSVQKAAEDLEHAHTLLNQLKETEVDDREAVAREIGSNLMNCRVSVGQHEDALDLAQSLLGPGGPLAGTDARRNYRILLGRAKALESLGRHTEARTGYNSVFRLLGESLSDTNALQARLGALKATGYVEGVAQAEQQLEELLAGLNAGLREEPEIARALSVVEAELRDLRLQSA